MASAVERAAKAGAAVAVGAVGLDPAGTRHVGHVVHPWRLIAALRAEQPFAVAIDQPPVRRSRVLKPAAAGFGRAGLRGGGEHREEEGEHGPILAGRSVPGKSHKTNFDSSGIKKIGVKLWGIKKFYLNSRFLCSIYVLFRVVAL